MAETKKSYRQLSQELDELLAWFESGEVDVDEALAKYEQALNMLARMEKHLKTAENKVKKIKLDLGEE